MLCAGATINISLSPDEACNEQLGSCHAWNNPVAVRAA
jgi:hypothetical protein